MPIFTSVLISGMGPAMKPTGTRLLPASTVDDYSVVVNGSKVLAMCEIEKYTNV
jgi:hypothetical protein